MPATKTKTKSQPRWSRKKIEEAYLKTLLTDGKKPASVFAFTDVIGLSEEKFYTFFNSFEAIENDIFTSLMTDTIQTVKSGGGYNDFSAREKLLTFYYAHVEVLKKHRSLVALKWPEVKRNPAKTPSWLKGYRAAFLEYANQIVLEAIAKDEIRQRPFLSDRYDKAFWIQLAFVVHFWINDESADFEKTDAAIEKAVNLSFQLLGDTTLDHFIDFAKFLWQSK